jgi:hypothetical protein
MKNLIFINFCYTYSASFFYNILLINFLNLYLFWILYFHPGIYRYLEADLIANLNLELETLEGEEFWLPRKFSIDLILHFIIILCSFSKNWWLKYPNSSDVIISNALDILGGFLVIKMSRATLFDKGIYKSSLYNEIWDGVSPKIYSSFEEECFYNGATLKSSYDSIKKTSLI